MVVEVVVKHTSYNYPRNGQYELFTFNGVTRCYDDPDLEPISNAPEEMFRWLRSQPGVRPADQYDVAFYLDPPTYLFWRLKWT